MTPEPDTLYTDPMSVFAFLATLVALIFWVSGLKAFRKFFEYVPPVIFVYFLPMAATTLGVTPPASPAYAFTTRYFLPLALFLLMISMDLRSVLRMGPMALFMMSAGTVGIILGGPLALLLFGHWLPPDAWKGFAALSGSWIGGVPNLVAIAQSVGATDSTLGPIIVVDTVVGYGWMGVLLFFSAWQRRYDTWARARTGALEETNRRLAEMDRDRHPTTVRDAAFLVGIGVGAAVLAVKLGARLPVLGDPTIITGTTWAVLIVVTGGLLLSFTPLREFEKVGASQLGYVALYLLLAGIGAQANLRAVLQAPVYLVAGMVWIGVHAAVLLAAARLVRAPLFFVATGSMANIGGPATAPVVAGVYHPAMAPVGLLMAVVGYVFGIYGGLACAWILGQVATLMGFVGG
jgi:uncharacterized membrane protein